jgi:hypothetical protein
LRGREVGVERGRPLQGGGFQHAAFGVCARQQPFARQHRSQSSTIVRLHGGAHSSGEVREASIGRAGAGFVECKGGIEADRRFAARSHQQALGAVQELQPLARLQ